MAEKPKLDIKPFDVSSAQDREAHEAVTPMLEASGHLRSTYPTPKLADSPNAPRVLEKNPAWNRRCVLAMAGQAAHWREQYKRVEDAYAAMTGPRNVPLDIGGASPLFVLQGIDTILSALLRRKLPLTADDVTFLAEVAADRSVGTIGYHGVPPSGVVKQAESLAEAGPLPDELRAALARLAEAVRGVAYRPDAKLAARIDALAGDAPAIGDGAAGGLKIAATVPPAAVGTPGVLVALKQRLGLLPADDVPSEPVGPDAFPLRADSPLRDEHARISELAAEFQTIEDERMAQINAMYEAQRGSARLASPAGRDPNVEAPKRRKRAAEQFWKQLHDRRDPTHLALYERAAHVRHGSVPWQVGHAVREAMETHAGTIPTKRDHAFDALLFASAYKDFRAVIPPFAGDVIERHAKERELSPGERHVAYRLLCVACETPPMGVLPPVADRLTKLLDGPGATLMLVPGEVWADAVHADLAAMKEGPRGAWVELLKHAATAEASKPAAKWAKAAGPLVKAVKPAAFRERAGAWLALFGRGRSVPLLGGAYQNDRAVNETPNDGNATVARGLVWTLADQADESTPRLMSDLLLTSIRKTPGVGPRCVKVANACVWALGEMAAVKDEATRDAALGQLARLKARVTFRTTLKAIETALDKAAAKAGVAKEDLEELGVPSFGFEAGERVEDLGGATVTLSLDGNKVTTAWTNDKGKAVKAPPASVKKEFKDDLKELKQAADDAAGVLLAGRDRLDNLYLTGKSWRLVDFRERYLAHGLLGPLARRLVWDVDGTAVLFTPDAATDVAGRSVELGQTAEVRLWHPISADADVVMAWRERLASLKITQPFKQAHREVYLLTDAERRTNTYSNRFAAHVVRQHQFNALCAARAWRNQLRLMVDDSYEPPRRDLPAHGLRAEFWVEGIGDDYGTDTTDSGSYLRLATDQVRFYRTGAARNYQHAGGGRYDTYGPADEVDNHPLPLDQIPPLVLSEILRDCDLFVGVSSVGNDPTWQDGGPEGRFRDYWQSYSFGDLNQTAQTRKTVLEKLVPRLKIAPRCSFSDKFLVVRGDRRTYKIHLGSGNILMEPNDQYLCIVPGRQADGAADSQFLPFEGDRTMSVIVSKALMLADDTKIKDPTITSQIGRAK